MVNFFSCLLFIFIFCPIFTFSQQINKSNNIAESNNKEVNQVIIRDPFLEDLQKRSFLYFWELANTENGLIPDRYPTPSFCSIAAVGFGLAAYIVGVERQWITREQAAERVLITLKFFFRSSQNSNPIATGYQGFYYHFLDMQTGLRYKNVELSTIDTTLFIAGVRCVANYFNDSTNPIEMEVQKLAENLYHRINWQWFYQKNNTISMGWHPESGFIQSNWHGYNEAMILYILALGSTTYPISNVSWETWCKTYTWENFSGYAHINFSPLFGHQYSHIFIDFNGIQDKYMREKKSDYFENSRQATYSNRQYCIDNPNDFVGYSKDIWGLTASDGPNKTALYKDKLVNFNGYWARGASILEICDDGTIAPTAAGGAIPFAPEICIPCLKSIHAKYKDRIWGKYGFYDAFNLSCSKEGWFDPDYLGIDVGPIVLMIENYYTGLIWELMKKDRYIVAGLKKAGFQGGWLEDEKK